MYGQILSILIPIAIFTFIFLIAIFTRYLIEWLIEIPSNLYNRRKILSVLQRLAERKEWMVKKHIFSYPSLHLEYSGTKISIRIKRETPFFSEEKTILDAFHNLNIGHRLTIHSKNILSSMLSKSFSKNIEVGSPEFDSKFTIAGDDEYFIYNLLDQKVQNILIDTIPHLFPEIKIKITSNRLKIIVPTVIRDEKGYRKIVECATIILDRLKSLKSL